jgi:hypothetical protein
VCKELSRRLALACRFRFALPLLQGVAAVLDVERLEVPLAEYIVSLAKS